MKKNKIVLFGAYDRYNYGDNLMPIVISDFIKSYRPDILESYDLVFSSISDSNLSQYDCPETVSINRIYNNLRQGDSILVCGGEVLSAKLSTLYLHMPKPKSLNDIFSFFNRRKYLNQAISYISKRFYPCPWDYPYIPDNLKLESNISILYNTVGGNLDDLKKSDLNRIKNRLNSSRFISVRDERTKKSLISNNVENINLAPDSVNIISKLYGNDHFLKKANIIFNKYNNVKYFCFQSAPSKIGSDIDVVVESLTNICKNNNCKVMLLPIGYACGHDDLYVLRKIYNKMPQYSMLEYELTVWEIMYIISNSVMYIGTSLHGAITALSYSIPHFGLNKKISKLDDFLKTWSVKPFNGCFDIQEIEKRSRNINSLETEALKEKTIENNEKVHENFNNMLDLLKSDSENEK